MPSAKERYSYSKLSAFDVCKLAYEKRYINRENGIGNCFSSYGLLVHSIMERYAKKQIDLWLLADIYEWEFQSKVPEPFPDSKFCPDMKDTYYKQGLNYLKQFSGYDDYKILEIETEFEIPIDDWVFNGVIDLLVEDADGNLIIKDYKSKARFKNKAEQAEYARQLYLYAIYVKTKYNKYPDELQFVMFRKQDIVSIKFDITKLNEAVDWARNTVENIRLCWDFPPTHDEFFCNNLCNYRNSCTHLQTIASAIPKTKKEAKPYLHRKRTNSKSKTKTG